MRGDYKDTDGTNKNRLRKWQKEDFAPREDDIFQERLYAIHWITKGSLEQSRQETFFTAVSQNDTQREQKVNQIVAEHIGQWQEEGIIPDMAIESGYNTDQPIRERGWTHWHHLFNARHLLMYALYFKNNTPEDYIFNAKSLDWNSRIANWMIHWEKQITFFITKR